MTHEELKINCRVRIAFVDVRYNSFYGAQQSMHTLMTNLDKNRFDPFLVTTEEGELSKHFRQSGIETQIIKASPLMNTFGNKVSQYSFFKKIQASFDLFKYNIQFAKWLKHNQIHIVYANNARVIAYIGLGTKIAKLPMVWYVRSEHRTNSLFKMGLFLSDRIITIAEGVKRAFTQKELQRYENKFETLYTGFDLERLTIPNDTSVVDWKNEVGIKQSSKVVGLVGSITPRKGHHTLIEAAKEILNQNPHVHFILLGDVPNGYNDYYLRLLKKVDELNLSNHFHWIGFVNDIYQYYSIMDVLVLPSQSEGLPRTVIEGLACGLPVVATDVGGVREIISEEVLGSVIEVDNPFQLSEEVLKFLENDKKIYRLRRHENVSHRFSLKNYAKGFEKIIMDLRKLH